MTNLNHLYEEEMNRAGLGADYVRPKTFGEAVEYASLQTGRKFDYYTSASNVGFDSGGYISPIVEEGSLWGSVVAPFNKAVASPQAVDHMIAMMGVPGLNRRFIMQGAPTEMAVYVMNEFLQSRNSKWKPRFYIGDDGTALLRAVGSSRYNMRLDNYDILSALATIPRRDGTPQFPDNMPLAGTSYHFPSFVDRDAMRIQMKVGGRIDLPDLPGGGMSAYGYGIRVSNHEAKGGKAKASFVLWRHACDNSIVSPFSAYEKSHSGVFLASTFANEAMAAIAAGVQGSDDENIFDLDAIAQLAAEAAAQELSTNGALDVIETFISTFSLGEEAVGDILDVARGYAQNRLGIAGAVTQYSHRLEDPKKQAEIEQAAGVYIFDPANFKNLKRVMAEEMIDEYVMA